MAHCFTVQWTLRPTNFNVIRKVNTLHATIIIMTQKIMTLKICYSLNWSFTALYYNAEIVMCDLENADLKYDLKGFV